MKGYFQFFKKILSIFNMCDMYDLTNPHIFPCDSMGDIIIHIT